MYVGSLRCSDICTFFSCL